MRLQSPKSKSDRTVAHLRALNLDALVAPVSRAWERIHITLGRGPKKNNWWGWAVGVDHKYPLPLRSASYTPNRT